MSGSLPRGLPINTDGHLYAVYQSYRDIRDVRGAAEIRALAFVQAENAEAVEEVAANLLAQIRGDRVVGAGQRLRRGKRAVDGYVLSEAADRK